MKGNISAFILWILDKISEDTPKSFVIRTIITILVSIIAAVITVHSNLC